MKLYLLMMGLYAVGVPNSGQNGAVEVLFLDAKAHSAAMAAVPNHTLRLQFYPRAAAADPTGKVANSELRWSSPVNLELGTGGPVTLQEESRFIDLTQVMDSKTPLRLRAECAGPAAIRSCVVDGHPALAARLVLTGGRLRPVELDPKTQALLRNLTSYQVEERKADFRPLGSPAREQAQRRETYNGMLYEVDLPADTRELELRIGDSKLVLVASPLLECKSLSASGTDGSDCIVLRLSNMVDASAIAMAESLLKAVNDQAGTDFALAKPSLVDTHFSLVYSLLAEAIDEEAQVLPHFDPEWEEPPYSRCIPPRLYLP